MRRILDAKYKKSDLNKVMTEQCQHLNTEECNRRMIVLRKYEDLFDVTLVNWNTTPVYLDLREDVKPVCSRPFPVPRVHESMFRKEVERIVNLGVLEELNNPKLGAPSFARSKEKTNRFRFLSDFRNLNRQLSVSPIQCQKYVKCY